MMMMYGIISVKYFHNDLNLIQHIMSCHQMHQLCVCVFFFHSDFLSPQTLGGCQFPETNCADMASVLQSDHSHLTDLDLSDSWDLKDLGKKALSAGLRSVH